MESIIIDNILSHITFNKLISTYQFGFLPGRSCTTPLLSILDYLTHHLDIRYSVDVIYSSFRKHLIQSTIT